jgi:hypothetical protein
VFADHERRRITKRMHAGRLEKARRGLTVTAIQAYGYRDDRPFEDEAKWVRFIFESAPELGTMAIAKRLMGLGVPAPRGGVHWEEKVVSYIRRNPVYKGTWVYGREGERIEVPCEAIVTEEQWDAAQAALQRRRRHRGRHGSRDHVYPLQGRIRCAHCGYAISGWNRVKRGKPTAHYYLCGRRYRGCPHRRSHRAAELHGVVAEALARILDDDGALARSIILPPTPARDTARDVERLQEQLRRAKDGYLKGVFDLEEFAQTRAEIDAKVAALEELARQPALKPVDVEAARARLRGALRLENFLEVVRAARVSVTLSMDGAIELELDP